MDAVWGNADPSQRFRSVYVLVKAGNFACVPAIICATLRDPPFHNECGWAGAVKPRGPRPAWQDAAQGQVWSCAAHRRTGDPWVCRQMEAFSLSPGKKPINPEPFCESSVRCSGCLSGDKQEKKRPMSCWSRQKDIQVLREKQLVR